MNTPIERARTDNAASKSDRHRIGDSGAGTEVCGGKERRVVPEIDRDCDRRNRPDVVARELEAAPADIAARIGVSERVVHHIGVAVV